MVYLGGGLLFLIGMAFWIWCVLDVISTDEVAIRNLPKLAWLFLVIILPMVGSVMWVVAGRPMGAGLYPGSQATGGSSRTMRYRGDLPPPRGPEDSPAYRRDVEEQRKLLGTWEEDLRRREEDLRRRENDEGTP